MTEHDGYRLNAETPAARALQAEFAQRSAECAALPGARLNLRYGPHERHALDVFSAGPEAPALIFFHGGYWRAGSKDARRFAAPHWLARGVSWVAVNYRLTPEFGLADCVADARAGFAWISGNARAIGLNPDALHLSGNSAGAHLAAMVAAEYPACSLAVVSGLFDLIPLIKTEVNQWLRLDTSEARALSPVNHLPARPMPVLTGVGGAETEAFKTQSRRYGEACRRSGNPVRSLQSPGRDHFQMIAEFGQPGTPLFTALADMIVETTEL